MKLILGTLLEIDVYILTLALHVERTLFLHKLNLKVGSNLVPVGTIWRIPTVVSDSTMAMLVLTEFTVTIHSLILITSTITNHTMNGKFGMYTRYTYSMYPLDRYF